MANTKLDMRQFVSGSKLKIFGWFLFLLMSLLPVVGLIGIATLFIHHEELNNVALTAVVIVAVTSLLFIAVGLYLLLRLTETVQSITSSVADTAGNFHMKSDPSPTDLLENRASFHQDDFARQHHLTNLRKLEEDLSTLQDVLPTRLALLEEEAGWARTFKSLLESSDSVVMVLDSENVVHYANEFARKHWGIVEEQTLGQSLSHSPLDQKSITELQRHIQNVSTTPTTLTLWGQDNQQCVVRFEGVSVPASNMPLSKAVILRDVTFVENLKDVLRKTYGQIVAGRLISGVAHELNNPLSAVLGFAELAETADETTSENGDSTTIIKREVQKASYLVDNLLNFARPAPHQASSSDIHEALERCLSLLSYRLRSQRILIYRDYETTLSRGKIKNYQLQQALMNVLLNAVEALKESETENRRIKIATFFTRERRFLGVSISDSGTGLPNDPDVFNRLFEPFFSRGLEKGNAVGLGLTVSREILRACGGELKADNSNEEGSNFQFELPIEYQVGMVHDVDLSNVREEGGSVYDEFRMLAVSRDCNFLENLEFIANQCNIEMETAAFSTEAINLVASREFNLCIVDSSIEAGSEQTLWECIIQNQPALAGNLLFATNDPKLSQKLANKLGIDPDILLKPIKRHEAKEKILEKMNVNAL